MNGRSGPAADLIASGLGWPEGPTARPVRPDRLIENLGRLPDQNPVPDGMRIGADHRLWVADIVAGGIHVLGPYSIVEGFIARGMATTNCVLAGEILWVTNAGVLATHIEPSFTGTRCLALSTQSKVGAVFTGGSGRQVTRGRADHLCNLVTRQHPGLINPLDIGTGERGQSRSANT